jgi:hypothetical protein
MKFGILSIAAVAAIAVSAGSASAHPPGYYSYGWGGPVIVRPAPVVVVPARPAFVYPNYGFNNFGYSSGFNLNVGRPGFNLNIGSGTVVPAYGGFYSRPFYGNPGWRW